MLGLITADTTFTKDPKAVEEMIKFLKENVSRDQRQLAKAINLVDPLRSNPQSKESELLEA